MTGTDILGCKFMDCVSDCAWNPRYNMFAVSGFGQEFPVLLYVYERSKVEIDEMFYRASQLGYKLTAQIDNQNNMNDPQNVNQLRQEAAMDVSTFKFN